VLATSPAANGDARLAIFDNAVTPNAHAIAGRWVLFDNFYVKRRGLGRRARVDRPGICERLQREDVAPDLFESA